MQSERNKAIFLDRDGVVNKERGDYTWLEKDFMLNDGLVQALKTFQDAGFLLIVISNQSGIAKGIYSKEDVELLHRHLINTLKKEGIGLLEIYYCPHHPTVSKCLCRKPDSMLLEKAIARFGIDPQKSWFIGDAQRDTEAGQKAGVRSLQIKPNSSLLEILPVILS